MANANEIELYGADPAFEYVPLRELEVRAEIRSGFSKPPNEEAANKQLRMLAASIGADAIVNVRYKRSAGVFSWHVLTATGVAVTKGPSTGPHSYPRKPLKSADAKLSPLVIVILVLFFLLLSLIVE